jgi:hypothetical protein
MPLEPGNILAAPRIVRIQWRLKLALIDRERTTGYAGASIDRSW